MTDGIRTTVDGEAWMRGIEVEPRDDGATETGETMETTKPSALATAVFNLCAPGGQTPEAMDAVVRAMTEPAATVARLASVMRGETTSMWAIVRRLESSAASPLLKSVHRRHRMRLLLRAAVGSRKRSYLRTCERAELAERLGREIERIAVKERTLSDGRVCPF